ncbi:hypothetical protein [Streptomyces sp. NPDC058086]|uniref:hypothetical protein n=1 Tax=Streptomyces sp. NPDC058086 TaxID=3346334 RepID=UPI0036E13697
MVEQEIYGYLLVHYAISVLVCQAATEADTDPVRVKFTRTVRIVRRQVADPAGFPPERLAATLAEVGTDITTRRNFHPRRRYRSCPRVVKRARHNSYRVKRSGDTGARHAGPPTIRLVNLHEPAAQQA